MGRPTAETLLRRLITVVNIAIFLAVSVAAALIPSQAKQGCESKCGDLEIPYPFGMKEGCYLNVNFIITCNTTGYNPPKPFLRNSNIEVTNISLYGELEILNYIARDCYTHDGRPASKNTPWLRVPMFTISNTKNKFTVVGCDTYAYIYGQLQGKTYKSGCMALCSANSNGTIKDGSCSGSGCCQLEIPRGLKDLELDVRSFDNHTKVYSFNPCGYAFVIQQNQFNFSRDYITNFTEDKVPIVLNWGINNHTCQPPNNGDKCLCGPNSKKNDSLSLDGSEYLCECLPGFHGNPYLPQGCRDINECEDGSNRCVSKAWCVNKEGNYTCQCPEKYEGDGLRDGTGCQRKYSKSMFTKITIGGGVGLVVLLIGTSWLYLGYKKWKFIQQKEKFFKKNGGAMLQQHLSQWQSPTDTVRIFSQEELEKATNKFHESTVVGKGGYGTVYKGVLDDGSIVAIKKSQLVDQSQTSQFINEVIVLSQVNHRNVVKLLGCCLETRVPLLVYEFITNGTLFDHIHDQTKYYSNHLSWEVRLRIASETAGVISYLHSSASTPIIHRDIKPTNILLDHNFTAKVSDFGASKLVPMDQTQLSTMVQGTLGYLDPEYLLTSELTEKSDVYSFGIVLLELITGKKAVCFDGPEVERNLGMYVLRAMKENCLAEIVDKGMVMDEGRLDQIKQVAKLAKECVRVKGEERPSMKDVAMELEGLRVMQVQHSWANVSNSEDMISLLDETSNSTSQFLTSTSINSMDNSAILMTHIPGGR